LAIVPDGLCQDIEERKRLLGGQVEPDADPSAKYLDPPERRAPVGRGVKSIYRPIARCGAGRPGSTLQ
jgi:hypothetical protein